MSGNIRIDNSGNNTPATQQVQDTRDVTRTPAETTRGVDTSTASSYIPEAVSPYVPRVIGSRIGLPAHIQMNNISLYSPTSNIKLALAYAGWRDVSGGYDEIMDEGSVTTGLTARDIEGIIEIFGEGSYELSGMHSLTDAQKETLKNTIEKLPEEKSDERTVLRLLASGYRSLSPAGFATLKNLSTAGGLDPEAARLINEITGMFTQNKEGMSADKIAALRGLLSLIKENTDRFGEKIYTLEPVSGEGQDVDTYNSAMNILADISMQIGLVTDLRPAPSLATPFFRLLLNSFWTGREMSLATPRDFPQVTGVDNNRLSIFKMVLYKERLEQMQASATAHEEFEKEFRGAASQIDRPYDGFETYAKAREAGEKMLDLLRSMPGQNALGAEKSAEYASRLASLEEKIGKTTSLKESNEIFGDLVVLASEVLHTLALRSTSELGFLTSGKVDIDMVDRMLEKSGAGDDGKDFISTALGNMKDFSIPDRDSKGKEITNYSQFVNDILKRDGGWSSLSVTVGEDADTTLAKRILSSYLMTAQIEQGEIGAVQTAVALIPVFGKLIKGLAGPAFMRGWDIKVPYGPASQEELFTVRGRLNNIAQTIGMSMGGSAENLSIFWYLALLTQREDPSRELSDRFAGGADALKSANSINAKTLKEIIEFLKATQKTFTQTDGYGRISSRMYSDGDIFYDPSKYEDWIPDLESLAKEMEQTGKDISVYYGPGSQRKATGLSQNADRCVQFLGQVLIDIYGVYGEAEMDMAYDHKNTSFKHMDLAKLPFVNPSASKNSQSVSVVDDEKGVPHEDPHGLWDSAVAIGSGLSTDVLARSFVEAGKTAYRIATIPPNIMMMFGQICYSTGDYLLSLRAYDRDDEASVNEYYQKRQSLASMMGNIFGAITSFNYDPRVWAGEVLEILYMDPDDITEADISKLIGSAYVLAPFVLNIAGRSAGIARHAARTAAGLDGSTKDFGIAGAPFRMAQDSARAVSRSGAVEGLHSAFSMADPSDPARWASGFRAIDAGLDALRAADRWTDANTSEAGKWIYDHASKAREGFRSARASISGPVDDYFDVKWEQMMSPLKSGAWTLQDWTRNFGDYLHEKAGVFRYATDGARFVLSDLFRTKTSSQIWGKYYRACSRARGKIFDRVSDTLHWRSSEQRAEIDRNSIYFFGERVVFYEQDAQGNKSIMKREDAQKYLMMAESAFAGEIAGRARTDLERFDALTIDRYIGEYLDMNPELLKNMVDFVKQNNTGLSADQAETQARALLRASMEDEIRGVLFDVMMGEAQRPVRHPLQATEDFKEDFGLGIKSQAERLERRLLEAAGKAEQGIDDITLKSLEADLKSLLVKMAGKEYWANVYQDALKDMTATYEGRNSGGDANQARVSAMLRTIGDLKNNIDAFSKMTGRERILMLFAEERLELMKDVAAWEKKGVPQGEVQQRINKRVENAVRRLGGSVEDVMAVLRLEVSKYGAEEVVMRLYGHQHAQTTVEISEGKAVKISGNMDFDPKLGAFIHQNREWLKENGITEIRCAKAYDNADSSFEIQSAQRGVDEGKALVISGDLPSGQEPTDSLNKLAEANQRYLDTASQRTSSASSAIGSYEEFVNYMQDKETDPIKVMAQAEYIGAVERSSISDTDLVEARNLFVDFEAELLVLKDNIPDELIRGLSISDKAKDLLLSANSTRKTKTAAEAAIRATGGNDVSAMAVSEINRNSLKNEWNKLKSDLEMDSASRREAILNGGRPPEMDGTLMQRCMEFSRKATYLLYSGDKNISMRLAQLESMFVPVRDTDIESVATLGAGYGKSLPEAWRAFFDHVYTGMPVRATTYTDSLVVQLCDDVKKIGDFLGIETGRIDETTSLSTQDMVREVNKPVHVMTETRRAFLDSMNMLTHTPIGPAHHLRVTDESQTSKGQNYTIQMVGTGGEQALAPIREAINIARGLAENTDYRIENPAEQKVTLTDSGKKKIAHLDAQQQERVVIALKLDKCMKEKADFMVDKDGGVYVLMEKSVPAPGKVLSGEEHLIFSMLKGTVLTDRGSASFQFDSHAHRQMDIDLNRYGPGFTATSGREYAEGTQVYRTTSPPIGEQTFTGFNVFNLDEARDDHIITRLNDSMKETPDNGKLVFFQNDIEAEAFQNRYPNTNGHTLRIISAESLAKELKAAGMANSELAVMVDRMVKQPGGEKTTIVCTLLAGVGADFSKVDLGIINLGIDISFEQQIQGRWGGFRSTGINVQVEQNLSLEKDSDGNYKSRFLQENGDKAVLDVIRVETENNGGRILAYSEAEKADYQQRHKPIYDYYRHLQVECEKTFKDRFEAQENYTKAIYHVLRKPLFDLSYELQEISGRAGATPADKVAEANWVLIEQVLRNAGIQPDEIKATRDKYIEAAKKELAKKPSNPEALFAKIFESVSKQHAMITDEVNKLANNNFAGAEIRAIHQTASGSFLRSIIPILPAQQAMEGILVKLPSEDGKTNEYALSKVVDDFIIRGSKAPLALVSTRPSSTARSGMSSEEPSKTARADQGEQSEEQRVAAGGDKKAATQQIDYDKVLDIFNQVLRPGKFRGAPVEQIPGYARLNDAEKRALKNMVDSQNTRGAHSGSITSEQAYVLKTAATVKAGDDVVKAAKEAYKILSEADEQGRYFFDPVVSAKIDGIQVLDDSVFSRARFDGDAAFIKGADGKYTIYIKRSACGTGAVPDVGSHARLFGVLAHELAEIDISERNPAYDRNQTAEAAHTVAKMVEDAVRSGTGSGDASDKTVRDRIAGLISSVQNTIQDKGLRAVETTREAAASGRQSVDVGAKMGFGMSLIIYNIVPELWKNGLENIKTSQYWTGSLSQSWQAARRGAFYALRDNLIQDYFSAILFGTNYSTLPVWQRTSFVRKSGFTAFNFGAMAVSGIFDDAILWARDNTHLIESKNPYEREYYYKMMTRKLVQGSVSNMAFELPGLVMAAMGNRIPQRLAMPLRTALGVATNMTSRQLFEKFAFNGLEQEYLGENGLIEQFNKGAVGYDAAKGEEEIKGMEAMASAMFYSPDFINGAAAISDIVASSMDAAIISGMASSTASRVLPQNAINWMQHAGSDAALQSSIRHEAAKLAARAGSDKIDDFMGAAAKSVNARAALTNGLTFAVAAKSGWDRADASPADNRTQADRIEYFKSLGLSMAEGGAYGVIPGLLMFGASTAALPVVLLGVAGAGTGFLARRAKELMWDIPMEAAESNRKSWEANSERNTRAGFNNALFGWMAGATGQTHTAYQLSMDKLRERYPDLSDDRLSEMQTISRLAYRGVMTNTPYNTSANQDDFQLISKYYASGEWRSDYEYNSDDYRHMQRSWQGKIKGETGKKLTQMAMNGWLREFDSQQQFVDAFVPNWRYLVYREVILQEEIPVTSFSTRMPEIFNSETVQGFIRDVKASGRIPRDISLEYVKDPSLIEKMPPDRFWSDGGFDVFYSDAEIKSAREELDAMNNQMVDFVMDNISEEDRDILAQSGQTLGPQDVLQYFGRARDNYINLENMRFVSGDSPVVHIPNSLRSSDLRAYQNINDQIMRILLGNGSIHRACYKHGIDDLNKLEQAPAELYGKVISEALQEMLGSDAPIVLITKEDLRKLSETWKELRAKDDIADELSIAMLADTGKNIGAIPLANISHYPKLYKELIEVLKKKGALSWALKDQGLKSDVELSALSDKQLNEVLSQALGFVLSANKFTVQTSNKGIRGYFQMPAYDIPHFTPQMAEVLSKPDILAYFRPTAYDIQMVGGP